MMSPDAAFSRVRVFSPAHLRELLRKGVEDFIIGSQGKAILVLQDNDRMLMHYPVGEGAFDADAPQGAGFIAALIASGDFYAQA